MKITYEFNDKDVEAINEELGEVVRKDYERYKNYWLSDVHTKEMIFREAYEIAKYTAIRDYLEDRIFSATDIGSIRLMTLVQILKQKELKENKVYLENITSLLYGFEMEYDRSMWCNYEDLDTIVEDYLEEINDI